jgi:small subunit ribosomal protein S18
MSNKDEIVDDVDVDDDSSSDDDQQVRSRRRSGPPRDSRGGGRGRPRPGGRRRARKTEYCPKGKCFDYKDVETLRRYVSETGKIRPRRQSGNCARCQRDLARQIKRARHLALLPFIGDDD